ncbi:sensor histidine kinase [Arthrobacter sp. TWP1-1]|uniref:sensor histidine kinase n=1 Tax=Arthrobacter sp. TWP1-1 TaxID=2804568 RepID=UPI003CF8E824
MPAISPEIPRPSAAPGRSVRTTWTYTLGSIVFVLVVLDATLLSLAVESFNAQYDVVSSLLVLSLLASVVPQIRYCWFLRAGLGGGLPRPLWTTALLVPALLVWLLGLFAPADTLMWALPLWLGITLIACLLPLRPRMTVLGAGLVVSLLHPFIYSLINGAHYDLPDNPGTRMLLVYAAGMPLLILSSLWWWGIVVELDRHRLLAAELAVAQERLRFAADLHDIQGHHLQVIALKSELAERLLAGNPDAAREHIHEARLIAKQALEETRSLVSGYRETVLENELENAREVLSAAGAHCELTLDPLPSSPAARNALAMIAREATTNILRHSEATHAAMALVTTADCCTLTISNNGVSGPAASQPSSGNGITGLRERVEALGGKLEITMNAERFELQASVPTKGTLA